MNKMIKTAIATAITALSFNASAEVDSPFSFIEYSVGTVQYDIDGADIDDGDYSALAVSVDLPLLPILSAEKIDIDGSDFAKLGAGMSLQISPDGHLYALVHYNDYNWDRDNDLSIRLGFKYFLMENLELDVAQTEYTDVDGLNSTKVSLDYYIHPNFSLSANYEMLEDMNIISGGVKVSF